MRITSICRITLVAVALVLAQMVPSPANAGGNWIDLNRRHLLVGAKVTARAIFFTESKAKVIEHGPYFAYIAPERMGWRLPDPSHPRTVRLGRVRVLWPEDHDWKGMFRNTPRARIGFEVPDMAVGKYVMSFCNRACSSALGDVDPTGYLWVVHTPAEGRLQHRLSEVREQLREERYRAGQIASRRAEALSRVGALEEQLEAAVGRFTTAQERAKELGRDLAAAKLRQARERFAFVTILAVVALMAIVGLIWWRRRDSRRLDDELRRMVDAAGGSRVLQESDSS